jgi:hypothetical protein
MRLNVKRILFVLVWCLVVAIWPAQAQDIPAFSSLALSLWPEFDRPGVLVIYRGTLSADTPLPASIEIRLPARVGAPSAVAYVDQTGQRLNQQYTTRVDGDSLVVEFELQSSSFQLEYYDQLPIDSAGKRTYTFSYTADYAVQALSVEFQVPPTAQDFALTPPADSVQQEADGLTYHLVQVGALAAGETRDWTFGYQKDNSDLTQPASAVAETPAAVSPAATGSTGNSDPLLFLLAFVVVIAVGSGAFWLGRRTQPNPEMPVSPSSGYKRRGSGHGTTSQSLPKSSLTAADKGFFCHQCGAELRSDAEFCHRCGAAVRRA